jgi:Domain of unknown function (DUF1929)/Ricin-type beta-trefoil lectin domain
LSAPKRRNRQVLAAGTAIAFVLAASSTPALAGSVSEVISWTSMPIHAALTPDGKIMTFGATPQNGQGGVDYTLWDPTKGTGSDSRLQLPNGVNFDSFCVGGVINPANGKLILAGGRGDSYSSGSATQSYGYDYSDRKLYVSETMRYPRYYASLTTLPDGRILVNGGAPPYGNQTNASPIAEIYQLGKGWTELPGTADSPMKRGDQFVTGNPFWYPHDYPIGNNQIFSIAGKYTFRLNYSGNGSFSDVQNVTQSNWGTSSTAVMFRPGLVLQIGGGAPGNNFGTDKGSNVASMYDLRTAIADPSKAITRQDSTMRLGRHFATATVMANGEVLVSGGSLGNNTLEGVTHRTEIFNPDTGTWRLDAGLKRPRLYHSVALLMKDGRVMTGGGGAPGPIDANDVEIYTPDYLLDSNGKPAVRPSILTGPASALSLGQSFTITTDKPVKRVTIVKTGTVTHSYNTDQRFFEARFTTSGNSTSIVFPNDAVNATPGIYMVFAYDANGVPSVGKFVRLKSPTGDTGYQLPNDMPTPTTATGTAKTQWAFCAPEGQSCPVTGTQNVRYGANGKYATRSVTGAVDCSNAIFGDPAPGIAKSCEFENTSLAASSGNSATDSADWTFCSAEGDTCSVSGTQNVRFGANSAFVTRSVAGSVKCDTATFGDPAPGIVKTCQVALTSTASNTGGTSSSNTSNTGTGTTGTGTTGTGTTGTGTTGTGTSTTSLANLLPMDHTASLLAAHSSLCMSVKGDSTNNGAVITSDTCRGVAAQRWQLIAQGSGYAVKNQASNRCLDVGGWSKDNGQTIIIYDCHGGANQTWSVRQTTKGLSLVASHSNKCIGVAGSSKTPGTGIVQWDCADIADQAVAEGPDRGVSLVAQQPLSASALTSKLPLDHSASLLAAHSNLCLTVKDDSANNGAIVTSNTCRSVAAQRWQFFAQGAGFAVKNAATNKCLDVGGWSKDNGQVLIMYDCHGGANQTWSVRQTAKGLSLVANHSNKCLDVEGQSTVPGARVWQWDCVATANQAVVEGTNRNP